MTVEEIDYLECSVELGVLHAFGWETDVVEGLEEWIQLAVWSNTVPRMSNLTSPLMSALWTATIGGEFEVDLHKQMKKKLNRDQHNKNPRIWSRIQRVLVNWSVMWFLRIWENVMNLDLILGNCEFCYDLDVINNIYASLNHD
jgi:hypothetical protein